MNARILVEADGFPARDPDGLVLHLDLDVRLADPGSSAIATKSSPCWKMLIGGNCPCPRSNRAANHYRNSVQRPLQGHQGIEVVGVRDHVSISAVTAPGLPILTIDCGAHSSLDPDQSERAPPVDTGNG